MRRWLARAANLGETARAAKLLEEAAQTEALVLRSSSAPLSGKSRCGGALVLNVQPAQPSAALALRATGAQRERLALCAAGTIARLHLHAPFRAARVRSCERTYLLHGDGVVAATLSGGRLRRFGRHLYGAQK